MRTNKFFQIYKKNSIELDCFYNSINLFNNLALTLEKFIEFGYSVNIIFDL